MNPQNGQTPVDYLNQIAPQAPKKPLFQLSIGKVVIIGLVLIAIVIILSVVMGALNSDKKEPWQQLSARLDTTSTLSSGATPHIKSSQLRSLNSDLTLYLTNTTRDLSDILEAKEIQTSKIPPSIIDSESGDAIVAELEDARLNNVYDITYAREMSYQLSRLVSLLEHMLNSAQGTAKEFLSTALENIKPLYTSIQNYSAVK